MKPAKHSFSLLLVLVVVCCSVLAQEQAIVPRLIKFSGKATDAQGKVISGIAGASFAIYKDSYDGAPLWIETQNFQADAKGNYSVQLGASKPGGLPLDLFTSGEARWLGVTISGGQEQPRTLLLSVPYALKALDAETLGGKPASAFMAAPASGNGTQQAGPQAEQKNEIVCSSGTACNTGYVPLFSTNGGSARVNNSIMNQSGSALNISGALNLFNTKASNGDINAAGTVTAAMVVANLSCCAGDAVFGSVATGSAVIGSANSGTGIYGTVGSGTGVYGTTSSGTGISGNSSSGYGIYGTASSGTAGVYGVLGSGDPVYSYGVYGENDSTTGGKGVFGFNKQGTGGVGVQGYAPGSNGIGVAGSSNTFGSIAHSVIGATPLGMIGDSSTGIGIMAASDGGFPLVVENGGTKDALFVYAEGGGYPIVAQGNAGYMVLDQNGNMTVSGALVASIKSFKIDHPVDPANKYLYHASVESSELLNIYTGTTLLDASGSATVDLPDWFEAVNGDFRYQLTAIGAPGPNLHVAQEISNNQFTIAGGQPGMKVSWQVTGVRHDAYARAHPMEISVDKPTGERGFYIHPELYGAPAEKSLAAAHRAQFPQLANHK